MLFPHGKEEKKLRPKGILSLLLDYGNPEDTHLVIKVRVVHLSVTRALHLSFSEFHYNEHPV